MPRLRILAGPSPTELYPISANNFQPYSCISSKKFEGQVVVHINGFLDENGSTKKYTSEYFDIPERKGVTWSIQVQGRFLEPISANDILFGNTFDKPLKLPWGSSAALKFMNLIDPTLEHDLLSDKPWALSPLISTMPNFAHRRLSAKARLPPFPPPHDSCINDSTKHLNECIKCPTVSPLPSFSSPSKRRNYFSSENKRKAVVFGPQDLVTTDFAYNFISFPSLTLDLPVGISFDLMKYWDGQPVRFVCCERPRNSYGGPGRMFWCVVFEVVLDEGCTR